MTNKDITKSLEGKPATLSQKKKSITVNANAAALVIYSREGDQRPCFFVFFYGFKWKRGFFTLKKNSFCEEIVHHLMNQKPVR